MIPIFLILPEKRIPSVLQNQLHFFKNGNGSLLSVFHLFLLMWQWESLQYFLTVRF